MGGGGLYFTVGYPLHPMYVKIRVFNSHRIPVGRQAVHCNIHVRSPLVLD